MVGQDLDSLGGVVLVMKLSSVTMSKRAKREKLKTKTTTCSLTKHEIWGKRLHPLSSVPERAEPGPGLPSAWRVR